MIFKIKSSTGDFEKKPCMNAYRNDPDDNFFVDWYVNINTNSEFRALLLEINHPIETTTDSDGHPLLIFCLDRELKKIDYTMSWTPEKVNKITHELVTK